MKKRSVNEVKRVISESWPSSSESPNSTDGKRPDLIRYFGDVDNKMLFSVCQRPHHFMFSSGGGCLYTMAAITDFLRLAGDIRIIATGQCMSAAVPVLAAGRERFCTSQTRFMVHPVYVSGSADLNINALQIEQTELRLKLQLMTRILAAHTKMPAKFWRDRMQGENYFGARDALKWGLVDFIL